LLLPLIRAECDKNCGKLLRIAKSMPVLAENHHLSSYYRLGVTFRVEGGTFWVVSWCSAFQLRPPTAMSPPPPAGPIPKAAAPKTRKSYFDDPNGTESLVHKNEKMILLDTGISGLGVPIVFLRFAALRTTSELRKKKI